MDRKLTLNVKTTNGDFRDEFNISNRGQKIVDTAIEKKKLDPHPPLPYILKRANGTTLPLAEKIESYGLRDGDIVIVQAPEATDG